MGLTYRGNKGSALTITELDDNFSYFTGSHAITGSLTISGSGGTTISLGNVWSVSNPSGSMQFSGSYNQSGSSNLNGSLSITGSATITGSLTVSGSTIYNYGGYHNYTDNVETFTITGSRVGINQTSPTTYDLEIVQASGATTASLHISGAVTWVKLENLPTTRDQASLLGTGSIFISGSGNNGAAPLWIITG